MQDFIPQTEFQIYLSTLAICIVILYQELQDYPNIGYWWQKFWWWAVDNTPIIKKLSDEHKGILLKPVALCEFCMLFWLQMGMAAFIIQKDLTVKTLCVILITQIIFVIYSKLTAVKEVDSVDSEENDPSQIGKD